MKKALVIKVDEKGNVTMVALPFEKGNLEYYYKELECDCIDIVPCYGLSIEADMIVDDEALCKENPIVNSAASLAYGVIEHGCPICGHAIICKPHETPDGVEETGFEEHELDKIMAEITNLMIRG